MSNNNLNKNCSKFNFDNQLIFDSKTKLKDDVCNWREFTEY